VHAELPLARLDVLVSCLSSSSHKSRPLLRAGFVATSLQFGFRPSPPLDRLAAEGGRNIQI
jgi:hypothetical protein